MREIKFRAWNTSNGMKYMDSDFFIGADGTIYDRASRTYDTPNLEIESVSSMILMQFTGLKDKNGQEIYEGDILSTDGVPNVTCYWFEAEARWNLKYRGLAKDCELNDSISFTSEVIGNIYENPELLKVEVKG